VGKDPALRHTNINPSGNAFESDCVAAPFYMRAANSGFKMCTII